MNPTFTPVSFDETPVEFRLFAFNGTGNPTAGTITTRLDDIQIFVAPVPEPATVLGLSAAGLGLAGFVRRRLGG